MSPQEPTAEAGTNRAAQSHPARRSSLRRLPLVRALVREQVVVEPRFLRLLERAGLTTLEGVWSLQGGEMVTRHRDRSVVRVELPDEEGRRTFFVKRLSGARPKHLLEDFLSMERTVSKCFREWNYAQLLGRDGLRAPQMVAAGEARLGPLPLESFLIVEALGGSRDLHEYLVELAREPSAVRSKRELISALARAVARMHASGLVHQDLYAKHIFVRRKGGGFDINVVDLQRMRRTRRESLAVKDLAALNVTLPGRLASTRDRLRFLVQYVAGRWGEGRRERAARLMRKVLRRSLHIGGRGKFRAIDWRHEGHA
jgi:hypothetical protein